MASVGQDQAGDTEENPLAQAPLVLVPLPGSGFIFRFPAACFLPSLPARSGSPGATPP